jgi:very-short-patch-repair endonuclease
VNNWKAIKEFYERNADAILSEPRNEWAIDPYAWAPFVEMTPIEEWLWGDIRAANAVFYPQWPVGGVFLDFANPVAKVAIECDGAAYHTDKEKDAARDTRL